MSKDVLRVILTGAASGVGAATAALLAKGRACIVFNYSNSQKEAEVPHCPDRVPARRTMKTFSLSLLGDLA